MADETSPTSSQGPSARAVIIVFAFVTIILAAAIAVVAITQVGTATASQSAATSSRLVRLEIDRLRQDAKDKDQLLADLTARIDAEAAKVTESLKALGAADAQTRTDLADAATQQKRQADLAQAAQQELGDRLTRLAERLEALRTEVVLKEARGLQDQVTEAKGRIERAEKDLAALRQAVNEVEIPRLQARVQEVDREVRQVGTDLRALATATETFRAETAQASEAFRAQVTEFFQDVLYNNPWGKYTPESPAPPPR